MCSWILSDTTSNSDRWWCKQFEQSSTSCTWSDVVTIKKLKHWSSYDLPPDTAGYKDYRDLTTFSVLIFLGLDTFSLSWTVSCESTVSKHVWGMLSSAFSVDSADNLFGKQSMSGLDHGPDWGSCLWVEGIMWWVHIVTCQSGTQLYVLRRPVILVINLHCVHWGLWGSACTALSEGALLYACVLLMMHVLKG